MKQISTLPRLRGRNGRTSTPSTRSTRSTRSARLARLRDRLTTRGRPGKRTLFLGAITIIGVAAAVPIARKAASMARTSLATRRARTAEQQRGLDPLTSLPNRAEAQWWLNHRLELTRTRGQRLAVLVMDLDDFAACNEIYGRAAGDHVLQVTAARLQALLRTGDMVCRTGNDTFMVIMDVGGPDHQVARIGERVVEAIAEPIVYDDETITVTASVGFAISHDREGDPGLLLGRADRAVIQAKASQRPIVQF